MKLVEIHETNTEKECSQDCVSQEPTPSGCPKCRRMRLSQIVNVTDKCPYCDEYVADVLLGEVLDDERE